MACYRHGTCMIRYPKQLEPTKHAQQEYPKPQQRHQKQTFIQIQKSLWLDLSFALCMQRSPRFKSLCKMLLLGQKAFS